MPQHNLLVLTNRDVDNVGDQLIEATVLSLIRAAMSNLGIADEDVKIASRGASIIPAKYLDTQDKALLKNAREAISTSDAVIFGGAPLFNYSYERFYKRTIHTIELAEEYGVPTLFSSIGVEKYSATDPRSQELKAAFSSPSIRQITTRDDIDSLQNYLADTTVPHSLVSDPAVFTKEVFDALVPAKVDQAESGKRTIGLIVTRAGIFADNRIDFTEKQQRKFWLDLIKKIKARGDDYIIFSTGFYPDEVFLHSLVRDHAIPSSKVRFTINAPEELLRAIAECDGIIAYRLHASIASYSYKVPAIGLSWNPKVPFFYETVGYGQRALPREEWNADTVLAALDTAMAEGVQHNDEFLYTVYETLFQGLKGIFAPDSSAEPYSIERLRKELPRYKGTGLGQYKGKVQRKLRRASSLYTRSTKRLEELEAENAVLLRKNEKLRELRAKQVPAPTGVKDTGRAFLRALKGAVTPKSR